MKKNLNYEAPASELLTVAMERNFVQTGGGNADAPGGKSGGVYGDDIDS